MKIWVDMTKVEELQARSVERAFNSKDLSILKE
jgi:nucleoside-triphosphatase THEP1